MNVFWLSCQLFVLLCMSEVDWWDGWGQNKRMFDRSWSGLVLWCCSHWGDLETGPLENYSRAFISQANKGNPSWPKCLAEKRGAVVTHLEALETCALFLSLIQNCLWMSFSVQISIYCPSTTQLGSHSPICGITDSMCTPGLWSQWEDNSLCTLRTCALFKVAADCWHAKKNYRLKCIYI